VEFTLDPANLELSLGKYLLGLFDFERLKPDIAEIIRSSIDENFLQGGRYGAKVDGEWTGGANRWKPSQRALGQGEAKTTRDSKGRFRKCGGGKTLADTGLLAASVDVYWQGDTLIITSNLRYAAALHYGATIQHPGGTPYVVRADGSKKRAVFLKKDGVYPLGTKFTKAHVIVLEARPFLVIQDEDYRDIYELVADSLG